MPALDDVVQAERLFMHQRTSGMGGRKEDTKLVPEPFAALVRRQKSL